MEGLYGQPPRPSRSQMVWAADVQTGNTKHPCLIFTSAKRRLGLLQKRVFVLGGFHESRIIIMKPYNLAAV